MESRVKRPPPYNTPPPRGMSIPFYAQVLLQLFRELGSLKRAAARAWVVRSACAHAAAASRRVGGRKDGGAGGLRAGEITVRTSRHRIVIDVRVATPTGEALTVTKTTSRHEETERRRDVKESRRGTRRWQQQAARRARYRIARRKVLCAETKP